ncbi:HD domain-containing protein [Mariprofundus sp. KV]|uniref:CCA tRNA nucleotidyltransferase n=1 Tax=Mariprofundus sp. KV TaxID=2608715 RepID=UPI0015A3D4D2|nr:HD domain-containing protein [Mariprofundus sp. KV]NWF35491.1 HD domain-containing protein [Mariprofundus sp. KV]
MSNEKSAIEQLKAIPLPAGLIKLCNRIREAGGLGWLVGGSVRDMLLGQNPKDFDLEVYGLEADQLKILLTAMGRTESVGKQFGIQKLWMDNLEIDVALPRTERKTATGHCGFSIQTDPHLSPEKASLRRDFTINAMMFDPLDESLLDFHGGLQDLQAGTLRHVSPAFAEDPLRPLRAMQFAARFQLSLHPDTALLCKGLLAEAEKLPTSRIWHEWKKWALSTHPSYGLAALLDSGWLAIYPELKTMIGCDQAPHWHPEGTVWNHTLQVCDQAAMISSREKLPEETRLLLVLSSLCHDVGKPDTTFINDKGNICSPGHAEAGVAISRSFLKRIATPSRLVDLILPLVKEHITHLHGEPTARAVRRLADRLMPANIELWEMLVEADASGRYPAPPSRPALIWLNLARKLKHQHNRPEPLLTGQMLLELGERSGPGMGEILSKAYQAQLDGTIFDRPSAMQWYHDYRPWNQGLEEDTRGQ